jgi:ubiquinone/menaquinone biosynthesis C-methylase UbiE
MKDLEFIAQQLRKPSGDFALTIAGKMNEGNRPLYDLTINTMEINDNDTILEIGFGNGFHFSELLSLKDGMRIYGIDYSGEMVNQATSKNAASITSGQLILTEGNSDHLPYEDHMFDKVFCNMVIYFWENPEDHLKEIHRVLKPGGKFYTGMRTRESMLQLPFTKYGFNLFKVDNWISVLKQNRFIVKGAVHQTDPPIQEDGEEIRLESVCVIAEK